MLCSIAEEREHIVHYITINKQHTINNKQTKNNKSRTTKQKQMMNGGIIKMILFKQLGKQYHHETGIINRLCLRDHNDNYYMGYERTVLHEGPRARHQQVKTSVQHRFIHVINCSFKESKKLLKRAHRLGPICSQHTFSKRGWISSVHVIYYRLRK